MHRYLKASRYFYSNSVGTTGLETHIFYFSAQSEWNDKIGNVHLGFKEMVEYI